MHGRANSDHIGWTDERVETLKKLWMEGLSASQIAGELGGGATRNTVIGKVHRLKLSARAKPTSGRNAAPRKRRNNGASTPAAAARPASNRRLTTGSNNTFNPAFTSSQPVVAESSVDDKPKAELIIGDVSAFFTPAAAELFIPEDKRLSLQQLNEHTCKWPIGDPLSKEFFFCGQHSLDHGPYCEFHSRRAYHQLDKKRGRKSDDYSNNKYIERVSA